MFVAFSCPAKEGACYGAGVLGADPVVRQAPGAFHLIPSLRRGILLADMRKNAESMRYAGLRCAIACAALTIGVIADAYRLFRWDPEANRGPIVTSEQAVHWPESRFLLRFRTLENEHLPTDIEITQQSWTELVERALQRWDRHSDLECRPDP